MAAFIHNALIFIFSHSFVFKIWLTNLIACDFHTEKLTFGMHTFLSCIFFSPFKNYFEINNGLSRLKSQDDIKKDYV
jgi:hypothetical protein